MDCLLSRSSHTTSENISSQTSQAYTAAPNGVGPLTPVSNPTSVDVPPLTSSNVYSSSIKDAAQVKSPPPMPFGEKIAVATGASVPWHAIWPCRAYEVDIQVSRAVDRFSSYFLILEYCSLWWSWPIGLLCFSPLTGHRLQSTDGLGAWVASKRSSESLRVPFGLSVHWTLWVRYSFVFSYKNKFCIVLAINFTAFTDDFRPSIILGFD